MTNTGRLVSVSSVALAIALVACSSSSPAGSGGSGSGSSSGKGGSGSGSSTGSAATTSLSSACTALQDWNAAYAARCFGGATATWELQLEAETPCSKLEAAVTAGRIKYDETQLAACVSALQSGTCSALAMGSTPTACKDTLSGTVAKNGTCHGDGDCEGSSYCSGLGGTTGACSGTCTPRIATGAACTTDDECVSGDACTESGSGSGASKTCTSIAATTPAAAGATCGYDKTTKTFVDCAAGLLCIGSPLVCTAPIAPGKACTTGEGACGALSYCDPSSKTCKSWGGAGAACGAVKDQDPIGCLAGTYCKTSTGTPLVGTCTTTEAGGAACTSATDCASGVCSKADGGTGTCVAACTEE